MSESSLDQRLRDAHRQRIAMRLPTLAWVVTGGSVLWFALAGAVDAARVASVVGPRGMLAIVALQGAAFAGVAVALRRDPTGRLVVPAAVGACVAVGLGWVVLLTSTATMAAMLTFGALTLLSAAPLVLAWGVGPQLAFQGTLSVLWVAMLPLLPRLLPLPEIVSGIAFGNVVALVVAQWAASAFRVEILARRAAVEFDSQLAASRDAYRALAENAVDLIWAIDLEGRWTYVNEALAKRCGRTPESMIGESTDRVLTPHPDNPDPAALIARMVAGETLPPQLMEMRTPDGPRWVEAIATPVYGPGGAIVGIQGSSRDVTERRAAEEAMRSSEERFRGVFDNAPTGMAVIAPDGEVLQVNRTLTRILGYREGELVGRRVQEFMHPEDVPPTERFVEAALAGQRDGFTIECRHLHRDGHVIWSFVGAFLERDRENRPRRFITHQTDVTDQRAAEAALRASEYRFRRLTDSMVAGVLIAEGNSIVYVNDAVSTITGFTREELLRMPAWDIVHPEDREIARGRMAARLGGAAVAPRNEYRVLTKSGETRVLDVSVVMLDIDGRRVMLGTGFDVTERRVAEHALRSSEARYRGLVDSQRELIARFDPSGVMTFANETYCTVYGVEAEDVIGKPFWPLVHPEDAAVAKAAIASAMHPPYRGEAELRSQTTAGWRWFHWEGGAILDASGAVVEVQAAGRDVTERRRAQDALRASLEELRRSEDKLRQISQRQLAIREEERKRLSFDLHDDVCQELVGIAILVDSVVGRLGPDAPAEALADLERSTRYLREVVDHLRVLARDLRPIVLKDLGLEGSLRALTTGLSNANTSVTTVVEGAIPRLEEWREVGVYRIAQEAVSNAVRHAGASRVTVTLHAQGAWLHLEVRDDGRGFDVEDGGADAFGLTSMQERAQTLGAHFTVRSAPGDGTIVVLACPTSASSDAITAA
jgi:PAS domain S-box-containing protein